MIIYGHRLYGKVDAVPGLGHVATRCFHVDFVPLIPTQGWLVFQQKGNQWRGIRVPLSAKSILIAWARLLFAVVGIGAIVAVIVGTTGRRSDEFSWVLPAGVAVVSAALLAFTMMHKSVTRASYARACQLAKLAKLNDAGMAALAAAYGQPPQRFGFEPIVAPATVAGPARPAVAMETPPAEVVRQAEADAAVPVEYADDEPGVENDAAPVAPAMQPLRETRRHG